MYCCGNSRETVRAGFVKSGGGKDVNCRASPLSPLEVHVHVHVRSEVVSGFHGVT